MSKNLEKLISSVIHLHKEEINLVKKQIKIPYQLNFKNIVSPENNTHLMGTFYEYFTQAIFGGKLLDSQYGNNNHENQEELFIIKPDLVDKKKKKIGESKACCSGESCNLLDQQIEKYKYLQYENPNSSVYFSIYRHVLRGITKKWRGTEDELIKDLSKKTKFSLVMPLSLILSLYESKNHDLVYRYNGNRFLKCSAIRSPTINKLFTSPKKIINDLGLEKQDYSINRFILPNNIQANKHKIKKFPFLIISDNKHEFWVKEFKQKYDEENPIPF